jgi:hypothetical protein
VAITVDEMTLVREATALAVKQILGKLKKPDGIAGMVALLRGQSIFVARRGNRLVTLHAD